MVALPSEESVQDILALPPRRLIQEGVPIATILLFWNLLAGIAQSQNVGGSVGTAGVVMAALYVVIRGVSLSEEALPPMTGDVESILYENASLAVPAGAWFLAAMAVGMVENGIYEFTWIFASVRTALAGAGLGVVGLYAVATGYRALGDRNAGGGPPADRGDVPDGGSASDETLSGDDTGSSSSDTGTGTDNPAADD